ncbi:MAG: response regulator [bacterium]|nr:response regulator [bacterium]
MDKLGIDVLLLVEDEQDHAFLIQEALKGNGHLVNEIKWVKNGREALDYINREGQYNKTNAPPPGLILLDVKMPELDGFEVLSVLKSHAEHKLIPVVMLTTTANSEDVKRAMSLGCNDYIVKPVSWEDFEQKVRKLGQYWAMISNARIAKEK